MKGDDLSRYLTIFGSKRTIRNENRRQESGVNDLYFIYKQGNWDEMFPIFEFLSSYSPQTSNLLDWICKSLYLYKGVKLNLIGLYKKSFSSLELHANVCTLMCDSCKSSYSLTLPWNEIFELGVCNPAPLSGPMYAIFMVSWLFTLHKS